jgi:hypothetical protein
MNLDFFVGSDRLTPFFDGEIAKIQAIKYAVPSVWQLAGEAIALTELLIPFVKTNMNSRPDDYRNNVLALWNRIRSYQVNSILQIFAQNFDEGLSILRMAAELCFVFKAISSDERNLELFLNDSQSESTSFRRDRKMDPSNATEKRIIDLYKFCCRFGTHGHKTNFMFDNGPSQPAVQGISQIAKHWFISFMPPHTFVFETVLRGNLWEGIDEWRLIMTKTEAKLLIATTNDPFFTSPH